MSNHATHRSSSRCVMAGRIGAVLAAACLLVLATRGQPGLAQSDAAAPPAAQAALSTRPMSYLGVFEPSEIKSYSQVVQFGQAVGRAPNLVLYFLGWNFFQVQFAQQAWAHNAFLVADLDPKGVSVLSIAKGQQDAHLHIVAKEVKSFGHPVIISFGHEMNGSFNTWGWKHVPAGTFVQAWRHIVNLFRGDGATNVTWLWTVNYESSGEGPISAWWPGPSFVNWVGIDGYFYGKTYTFGNLFSPTIRTIRTLTKVDPILIGETAAGQYAGQAAKIPGLFAGASRDQLLGVVWFDETQKGSFWKQNWRIEGNPVSVGTFKKTVKQYMK